MKNIAPIPDTQSSADGGNADANNRKQSPVPETTVDGHNSDVTTTHDAGDDHDAQRRDLLSRVEAALDGEVMMTEQAMIDGLDLLTDLLRREQSCLGTATSITEYTSRATYVDRLPELVNVVCVKYETQTRVWLKRVIAVRELLGQFCDLVDNRLKEGGVVEHQSFPKTTAVDSAPFDAENEANMMARVADARLAVGRASARVAKSEEQAAKLERDATEAAQRAIQVAHVAREAQRRLADAAEAEDRKRKEDKERAEREECELRMRVKEKEEEERSKARTREERDHISESSEKKLLADEDTLRKTDNISTWPLFVYSVDPGDTGIGLGCVVRAYPGQLGRDDIEVNRVEQLNCSLALGPGEELVSNIVDIGLRSPGNAVKDNWRELDPPAAVAVPYINQRTMPSRESVVMVTTSGDVSESECVSWAETTTREVMLDDIRDYKFVEIRLSDLRAGVRLAVISRFKREVMSVSKKVLRVCSSADPRVSFTFNPATLTTKKSANFMVEVQPIDLLSVQDIKHSFPDTCERLVAVSPMIRLTAINSSSTKSRASNEASNSPLPQTLAKQPVVISLPVPPNPLKLRRPATSMTDGRSKSSEGSLESANGEGRNQNHAGASSAGGQAGKGRPKTAATFYKSGSDEVTEDTVCLLVKDEVDPNGKWTVMSGVKGVPIKNTDVINFELKQIVTGRIVAVRNLVGGPQSAIESTVRQLELGLQVTAVNAVLRHDLGDSTAATTEVNVHLIPPGSVNRTIKKLADDGYPNGPPAGPEILLKEGQCLTVRFRGNICAADRSMEIRMVYNSNIRSRLDFRATVTDKFAQRSIDVYRGFVQVYTDLASTTKTAQLQRQMSTAASRSTTAPNTTQSRGGAATFDESSETLLCELLVTIPKPEPETMKPIVSRAPLILHTEGVVDVELLRHLASEIGNEWRHLAHSLGIRRVRLQAILRNHNGSNDTHQTVYEMLMSWMKKLPRSVNKAGLLRTALLNSGRSDLAELVATRQYESSRQAACQSARGSTLRRAMVTVARHSDLLPNWPSFCSLLGLNEDDINEIQQCHQGQRERCYESLVCWAQRENDADDEQQGRVVGFETERTVQGLIQLLRKGRHRELADIVQMECYSRG